MECRNQSPQISQFTRTKMKRSGAAIHAGQSKSPKNINAWMNQGLCSEYHGPRVDWLWQQHECRGHNDRRNQRGDK
jgi:hypothetical protein